MIDRKARAIALAAVLLVLGFAVGRAPVLLAEYSTIKGTVAEALFKAQTVAPGGTATSASFTALGQTNHQSVQFRGVGTSPNYKMEVLITVDGRNYVKPETGGDLGTYDDEEYHIKALQLPLCVGLRLKGTELGASNSVAFDSTVRSQ